MLVFYLLQNFGFLESLRCKSAPARDRGRYIVIVSEGEGQASRPHAGAVGDCIFQLHDGKVVVWTEQDSKSCDIFGLPPIPSQPGWGIHLHGVWSISGCQESQLCTPTTTFHSSKSSGVKLSQWAPVLSKLYFNYSMQNAKICSYLVLDEEQAGVGLPA